MSSTVKVCCSSVKFFIDFGDLNSTKRYLNVYYDSNLTLKILPRIFNEIAKGSLPNFLDNIKAI